MNKKFKVVLCGCGGISSAWLESAKKIDEIQIEALVDINKSRAEQVREKFNLPSEVSDDFTSTIKKMKPDIVFDCTVPSAHPEITITALKNGCHVLGEKPMAENMKSARKMLETADKAGKIYAVIQNRRYMNNIFAYRKSIHSGKIGELTTLNADFYIGAHFGGFRDEMLHVLLIDMAIHSFDQARYISNADPISVYCHEWNPKGSWYKHGASAIAIFEMTNGVVFSYRGSWCAEGMNTSWECSWRAIGTKGSILWDGADKINGQVVINNEGFVREKEDFSITVENELPYHHHEGVIREFIESIKTGKRPMTDCHDNIKSLSMVHAAVKSAVTGKKVKIDTIL
ncbi:MAG TPA: Gfo/Idh/MocA family oxidoreductase [Victivallales bacterium]|nr:Gfo/Idh/MocA family oxidoreductase [Victivallales bacterium]HPO91745.1 Gfo/Idh/MocA family oxidoreductase [Victivallales bacterium]HRR05730.1 Gfo/Idh/MocA family oxidoreductase [Victivallales bacterium]HRR28475.1 Gfo/Idh/MocA family oxidoreductase [Victivallales bacterium]HRU00684.1 Gfo/Idh/MocA family oxidoreductase [Victivallales bacterium]